MARGGGVCLRDERPSRGSGGNGDTLQLRPDAGRDDGRAGDAAFRLRPPCARAGVSKRDHLHLFPLGGRRCGEAEMRRAAFSSVLGAVLLVCIFPSRAAGLERWSSAHAQSWYAAQPWILGSNYVPSDAINELEMWQAATFDPKRIDVELGWAQGLGMNTMRVFLHDLLWEQDPSGFKQRIRVFLQIAAKHHIKPIFVLFDSCWDPDPRLGPQHPPIPGVHNSGWVQAPGAKALDDPSQYG